MADIQALINRLDKVRETGRDRYIAKCPAHDDGDPSLSIRQLPDSRILLKCFAGCGAVDVLNALGLDWQSLMPDDGLYEPIAERRERAARSDLMVEYLEVVRQQGGRLSEDDKALLIKRKLGL